MLQKRTLLQPGAPEAMKLDRLYARATVVNSLPYSICDEKHWRHYQSVCYFYLHH